MAKDKNIELERKAVYLANTKVRKQIRKDKRKLSWRHKVKECPDCGGTMVWCCEMWSKVCCIEYGTCLCS